MQRGYRGTCRGDIGVHVEGYRVWGEGGDIYRGTCVEGTALCSAT